ncbi:MAG: MerR family transcriptional regulator [Myxococcota bacterium]
MSELTGVKAHVLRYWETEFRWMAPPKSRSKQRLYRKRDIEFVWLLKKLLWEKRFTIAGARQRIQELGLEESLARNAEGEASEAFFSASDVAQVAIGAGDETDSPRPAPARNEKPEGDWLGIRAALDEMQAELLSLRGVLQQGL